VSVDNPNSVDVDLTWSLAGPFALKDMPARVAAGSSAPVDVTFTPSVEGAAVGTLTVNGIAIALTASGFDPHCLGTARATSAYDPAQGACVTSLLPDGTDCGAAYACLSHATCQAGQCVGDATQCSDGNPCTLDVCGTTGCGHVDALPYCPEPDDPCQVPSCDVDAGCGATAAPDGTDCGPRDCHNAHVCIGGACVVRPVPSNQSCVDVVAGVPAGVGTADGQGVLARFLKPGPATYDGSGNRYMASGCALRRVTPAGQVRTLAGDPRDCRVLDGFGNAARFQKIDGVVFDGVNLVVMDACALRKVTLAGLVTTWVGDGTCQAPRRDGIGRQATVVNVQIMTDGLLTRDPTGALWFLDTDLPANLSDAGFWLRQVSPNGEVFTRGRLQFPPNAAMDTFDATLAATPDGRLFAVIPTTPPVGDSVNTLVEVLSNGVLRLPGWGGDLHTIASTPTGFLGATQDTLIAYSTDGGASVVAASAHSPSSSYADGPLDAGRFGYASGLAVNAAGDVSFYDEENNDVRLVSGGMLTTLAGPKPDRRIVDGSGAGTRLKHPLGIATAPSGTTYFSDEGCIRRLDTSDRLSTIVASDGGFRVDGPFTATVLLPSLVAVRSSGDVLFVEDATVRLAMLNAAWVTTLEWEPNVLWGLAAGPGGAYAWTELSPTLSDLALWLRSEDGGVQRSSVLNPLWLAADPDGGYLVEAGCDLQHVDLDGTATLFAPAVCMNAPFKAATLDAAGTLYLLDTADNLLWRRTPAGVMTAVLDLADRPIALSAEPSGSVLILVPEAILRFHP
jgi:hypothetical protein